MKQMAIGIMLAAALAVQTPVLAAEAALPKQKVLHVQVEGAREERTANLWMSKNGYYLYVLPQFTASAEEPGKDIVFAKANGSFFMRIEPLASGTDIAKVRENVKKELRAVAKPRDLAINEQPAEFPSNARMHFHMRAGTAKLEKDVLLLEVGGRLFRVTLHMPTGEGAEGLTPSLWQMLWTLAPLPTYK